MTLGERRRPDFDPIQLVVMANRLEGVVREMTNTLLRTGRSTVLATARDFSCSLVTWQHDLIATAEGVPVHVFGSALLSESMAALHPDFAEGDAFLHNDPYLGNSHPADHTILVPVFHEGVHVFTACAKAHEADIGNALPTTYMPTARDVYEEGCLIFPCVRIQREYSDVDDIIRMCRKRIRVPDVWYGDYLAKLGACRVAERRLKEFCANYGVSAIKDFCAEWLNVSERRAAQALKELPSGNVEAHGRLDLCPGREGGIPLEAKIRVDSAEGRAQIDLRGNPDCVPTGMNLTESTSTNSAIAGILMVLNSKKDAVESRVPTNAGTFRRFDILIRENCVAGIPRHPASCSMATSSATDRLVAMIQAAFAEIGEGIGLAEPGFGLPPYCAVISGIDARDGAAYVTQLFVGTSGGPASSESDGWLHYLNTGVAGLLYRDSIEVDEQKYPIIVRESRIRTDSEGAGRTRGAPGNLAIFGPVDGNMTVHYTMDGIETLPRGVRGGRSPQGPSAFGVRPDGTQLEYPDPAGVVELQPGEFVGSRSSGGGGYGDPFARDTDSVLKDVSEGYISTERAREVYGVVLTGDDTRWETLSCDVAATEALRRR